MLPILAKRGFTLIELLIVISIMALLSVVAYANFKDFAQDRVVNKAIGQIQTALRLAQANATSSFLCQGLASVDWSVSIRADKINVDLTCGESGFVVQTTTLQNVLVDSIEGSACTSPTDILPLTITYSKLSGKVKIKGAEGAPSCIDQSQQVSVNIKNTKTSIIKTFTISKGGTINVQ